MKRWKNICLRTTICFAIVASVVCPLILIEVILPRRDFRAECENPGATSDTLRATAHRCLAWNIDHDAFLVLKKAGDQSSIPVLIHSLRRMPKDAVRVGGVACTWDHCREALVAITGKDFGYDPDRWQAWSENNRIEETADSKPPKAVPRPPGKP